MLLRIVTGLNQYSIQEAKPPGTLAEIGERVVDLEIAVISLSASYD